MERSVDQRVDLQVRAWEVRQRALGALAVAEMPQQPSVESVNAANVAEQAQAATVKA